MNPLEAAELEYAELEYKEMEEEREKSHPYYKLAQFIANHPQLNKGVENAANIAQYPGAVAGGAVQELGDLGASLGNLGLKPLNYAAGTDFNIPHPELRNQFDEGLGLDALFGAGQLGAGLATLLGTGGGTGIAQLGARLPRLPGKGGLLSDLIYGAGEGYALGENAEGDRTTGTALGALFQPLNSISNRGLTERILRDREMQLGKHNEKYENIFGSAEKAGIKPYEENLDWDAINRLMSKKGAPADFKAAIDKYLNDSSIRNLQNLQSEMGKYERAIERDPRAKTRSLPGPLQERLEAAKGIQRSGQEAITESFSKAGRPDLASQYPEVTASYAKNAAPYFVPEIENVLLGQKYPEKLAQRLKNNEKFMLDIGRQKYPEIQYGALFEKLKPWLKGAGAGAAAYVGIPKVLHAGEAKKGKKSGKEPFLETGKYSVYD